MTTMASTENLEQCSMAANPKSRLFRSEVSLSDPCSLPKIRDTILGWSIIADVLECHQVEKDLSAYLGHLYHELTLERGSAAIMAGVAQEVYTLSIRVSGDKWSVNLFDTDYETLSPPASGWTVTPAQGLSNECGDWLTWLEEFEVRFDKGYEHLKVIYNRCGFETAIWQRRNNGRQGADMHGGSGLDNASLETEDVGLGTETRVRMRASTMPLPFHIG